MSIGLHLSLMIVTLIVGFFTTGWSVIEFYEELMTAGVPRWVLYITPPILWPVTAILIFRFLPTCCPGCGRYTGSPASASPHAATSCCPESAKPSQRPHLSPCTCAQ